MLSSRVLPLLFLIGIVSTGATGRAEPLPSRSPLVRFTQKATHPVAHRAARLLPGRIDGAEHIPAHGPVIFAPNHASHLDPVLVHLASPRPIHFMAARWLFEKPLSRLVMRAFGAFEVDQRGAAPETLTTTTALLHEGLAVGIFPEGGIRHGDRSVLNGGPLKKGVGWFAAQTDAPVVPVLIRNGGSLASARVTFLPPITAPSGLPPREAATRVTDELARSLRQAASAR